MPNLVDDTPFNSLMLAQVASPPAPSAAKTLFYAKSDGMVYKIAVGGVESVVGSGNTTGTRAARPAASSANNGQSYYATDSGVTYTSNGTTWAVAGFSPIVSQTIPTSSPLEDGQLWRYEAGDLAGGPTFPWTFCYRAASTSAYKWELVGGAYQWGIAASDAVAQTVLANTATQLTSPYIPFPFNGDWDIEIAASVSTTASGSLYLLASDNSKTTLTHARTLVAVASTIAPFVSHLGRALGVSKATNVGTNVTYSVTVGMTVYFYGATQRIRPVRVG